MIITTEVIIAIATSVNVIVFIVAVYFNSKSNKIANKMFNLSQAINKETSEYRNNNNRIFWALIFSSVLTIENRTHRKDRLGFLLKIFGWEKILKESQISPDELEKATNASCDKFFEEAIKEAKKSTDK